METEQNILLPSRLLKLQQQMVEADEGFKRHKALLDLGESLLLYLVGILLGEYRRNAVAADALETEFYKFSSRKLSMGNYQSLLRMLAGNVSSSILSTRLGNRQLYPAIGVLELEFTVLRQVIDDGADEGFLPRMDPLRQGRGVPSRTLPEFFDLLVMIRNIFAHPEEKAGKQVKRKWPLNEDYFQVINDPLEKVLQDLLTDLSIPLSAYPPALVRLIDERSQTLHYTLEVGEVPQEKVLEWSSADPSVHLTMNLTYLLDSRNQFFAQLYYGKIPSVSAEIAQRIMVTEKAKERTPMLLEMIKGKLANDGRLDDLELLVLRDTAKTNYIDEKTLFGLIEKVRAEMGIAAETGSPEKPGSLFIRSHRASTQAPIFNPLLLRYFMLVDRLPHDVSDRELAEYKEMEKRIANIRKEIKDMPVVGKIERKEAELRKLKTKKRESLQKLRERIRQCKEDLREATSDERKLKYRERLAELEQEMAGKENGFTEELMTLETELSELEQKRIADAALREQEASRLEEQNEDFYGHTIRGNHAEIWNECSRFVEQLVQRNLNQGGEESVRWVSKDNNWQQGRLTFNYWGRIYPEKAPLNQVIHLGLSIRGDLPWRPAEVDESVRDLLTGPTVLVCTAFHENDLFRLGLDKPLLNSRYIQNLVDQYAKELTDLGVLLVIQPKEKSTEWFWEISRLVTMETYLADTNGYVVRGIFSRPWKLKDFMTDGATDPAKVADFDAKISALLTLFSNAILMANDWALTQGINEEDLERREDRFIRFREEFHSRFDEVRASNGGVDFSAEQVKMWREAAESEFGLAGRVLDQVLGKYKTGLKSGKRKE